MIRKRSETMKQYLSALFGLGAVMTLVGACIFVTAWHDYAPYVFTIGAGFVTIAQISTPVNGSGSTLKRLKRIQIFGGVALVLTGMFMVFTHGNEWIACLAIAAFLQVYTAFRIPHEEEKEKE